MLRNGGQTFLPHTLPTTAAALPFSCAAIEKGECVQPPGCILSSHGAATRFKNLVSTLHKLCVCPRLECALDLNGCVRKLDLVSSFRSLLFLFTVPIALYYLYQQLQLLWWCSLFIRHFSHRMYLFMYLFISFDFSPTFLSPKPWNQG